MQRMPDLDLSRLDLNLLKVFAALIDEGSVTAAGEQLGLSQPTVSHSLGRLRRAFNDPLFVRSKQGLQPTPVALQLREPVTRALAILREALEQQQIFQPGSSTRVFNLLMTDIGETLFVPPLIARVRSLAPHVRLVIHQLPRQDYKEALESGTADLAIGQLPHGQADLVQQALYVEPFEGYARAGHPILKNPSLEAFLEASHLIVGRPAVAEIHLQKALGTLASKRKIALELRHYLSAAFVLAHTDLIAVLPGTLSEFSASFKTLGRFTPPMDIEPVVMRQFWHARSTQDEGCKWLRGLVAELFQRRSSTATPGADRSVVPLNPKAGTARKTRA